MKTIYKGIEIRSEYVGNKNWPCDEHFTNYNYHRIYLKNQNMKKSTYFEYWASNAHPTITDEKDLFEALQCFLSDAMAGDMEFEQFCAEFGYDVYKPDGYINANSKRIWKACKNAREKFNRVFVGIDLYDLYNEVQDMLD